MNNLMESLQKYIENAWNDRALLKEKETINAIRQVIDLLDMGTLRVAEPKNGDWIVNEWVKKAVVLYSSIQQMYTFEACIFQYHAKIQLKRNFEAKGIRVVPNAVVRHV